MTRRGSNPLQDALGYFRDLGVREVYAGRRVPDRSAAGPPRSSAERAVPPPGPLASSPPRRAAPHASIAIASVGASAPSPRAGEGSEERIPFPFPDLDTLGTFLRDCPRCKLCAKRTQVVFGVGNPRARLMFIGEGPGEDEDRQGEPFVGRAGQLLTDIVRKGMGLERADIYIANVVKCRPPQNRNPEPDEIAACTPFLREQIRLLEPEVIVTLGKFAGQYLLGVDTPITRLRGRWGEFEGIPLMPTFHPAYLLRTPAAKKETWDDVKQVMARLAIPLPPR